MKAEEPPVASDAHDAGDGGLPSIAVREALARRIVRWTLPVMLTGALVSLAVLFLSGAESTRFVGSAGWLLSLLVSGGFAWRGRFLPSAAALCIGLGLVTGSAALMNSVHSYGFVGNLVLMTLVVPLFGPRWGWALVLWTLLTGAGWFGLDAQGLATSVRNNTDLNAYIFTSILLVLTFAMVTMPTRMLSDALKSSESRMVALQKARDDEAKVRTELAHARRLEALGQLSGGVAHDFNNMLGAIMGATELIAVAQPRGQNDDVDQSVDLLREASTRASQLTRKLLAFGRQDRFESSHVDVNDLITDVLALARPSLGGGISVRLQLAETPLRVWGDGSALEHALLNLVLNARDAMGKGGTLTVTTRQVTLETQWCESVPFDVEPGKAVLITLEDTGSGIPSDVRDRVFEPFFTTKPAGRGTGLGLSAVHGTVVSHRGAIEVDSTEGRGTVFRMYLPVSEPVLVEAAHKREGSSSAGLPKAGGTVLLVDDNELSRRALTALLGHLGFQIVAAPDATAALAELRARQDITVVLSDVVMPGTDGVAFAQRVTALFPNTPVVLMSGFAPRDHTEAETRQYKLLRKPVQRKELERALRTAIVEARTRDALA